MSSTAKSKNLKPPGTKPLPPPAPPRKRTPLKTVNIQAAIDAENLFTNAKKSFEGGVISEPTITEDQIADEIIDRIQDHWNEIIQLPRNAAFAIIKTAILKPVRKAINA